MSAITLATATENRDAWIAASIAVAAKQSYRISVNGIDRELTYVNADHIKSMIDYWDAKVQQLTPSGAGGRRRVRYVVPE